MHRLWSNIENIWIGFIKKHVRERKREPETKGFKSKELLWLWNIQDRKRWDMKMESWIWKREPVNIQLSLQNNNSKENIIGDYQEKCSIISLSRLQYSSGSWPSPRWQMLLLSLQPAHTCYKIIVKA